MGGKIVLVARKVVADGDDRLLAFLEPYDLVGQFLEFAQTAAGQPARVQHQCFYTVIVRGSAYRIDQVLEQGFAHVDALRLGNCTLQYPARELLDQGPFRGDHQRSLCRHARRFLRGQTGNQNAHDGEQEDQMQNLPDAFDSTPNAHKHGLHQSAYVHRLLTPTESFNCEV